MKCRTCARRLDLEKLDYTVGCKHEQMEGFVCLACAHEGVAYWMTNTSEDNYCEEYVERISNAFPTHECVKPTHECVKKQVTGKLMNVEIPTKRESEEAEKQVEGELISRQAVLDFVGSMEMTDQISADAYKELTIYLEGLLSEPVGNSEQLEWISCSERLPEEDVEVLITYRYKEGEGDTSHADIDITTYGQMYFGGNKVGNHKHWRQPFEYFESNYEVVAWMPLPEPYKERRTDG